MKQYKSEHLDRYATTDADRATFAALVDCGGDYKAMAEALGISQAQVRNRLYKLRKKATAAGWAPNQDVTKPVAVGQHLKGTSTLYRRDPDTGKDEVVIQWVKTDQDREDRMEAMRIACAEMMEPLKGHAARVRKPKARLKKDLMAVYLIGDHHTGMYSWAAETGADYDCKIAERVLYEAFDELAAAAPPAQKGLIISVGDFFHADDHSSRTPMSGHVLDTDTRHAAVIQAGIRMWKRSIRFALQRHAEVEVVIVPGNHDPESSIWLTHALAAMYESEPRVTIKLDPAAHRYVRWGKCLIGTTHGHKSKGKDLGPIMAVDEREAWGQVKHCHVYTGHEHHKRVEEFRGVTVECLSVLAPGDAWHASMGYRSQRGMQLDVWHKTRGRGITVRGTVEYRK